MRAGFLGSKALRGEVGDSIAQSAIAERATIYTALPGQVVSFDPATQTADIQPLYRARFNGKPVSIPVLTGVPVVLPRAGGFALTFPINPGDGVQLLFQCRDVSRWLETGGEQEADSARMHDLSDAVAIPGLEPLPQALVNYRADVIEMRNAAGTSRIGIDGQGRVIMGAGAESLLGLIDEFMAVMETHTNDGDPHDQAAEVAALRVRWNAARGL